MVQGKATTRLHGNRTKSTQTHDRQQRLQRKEGRKLAVVTILKEHWTRTAAHGLNETQCDWAWALLVPADGSTAAPLTAYTSAVRLRAAVWIARWSLVVSGNPPLFPNWRAPPAPSHTTWVQQVRN